MSGQLLEPYRPWLEDSIAAVVRAWCPDAVRRRYEQATEAFIVRTTDEAASRRYAEACPVAHVDHTLYRLRELALPGGIQSAFADLYRSFHRARPDLEEQVQASKCEALVECAEAGGLYGCFAGEEVVGVMAVKPGTQYSVEAWLMWDIVLARPHCGKGLAPILQRAVLDQLDIRRAPLVVGTINARNLPSLRTALRVGRQVVGTWCFICS